MKNYYSILGVSSDTSIEDIAKAYRKRLKIVHPDRFDPRTQAEEWQQANKMLQELNEAYAWVKANHGRSTSAGTYRAESSAKQGRQEPPREEQEPKRGRTESASASAAEAGAQGKGPTRARTSSLTANHIHFLNALKKDNDGAITFRQHSVEFAVVFLALSLLAIWGIASAIQDAASLATDTFTVQVLFMFGLAGLAAKCSLSVYNFIYARVKPCVIFTPMYFIKVTYSDIVFGYSWEIDSINYHREKYSGYFNFRLGSYTDSFSAPAFFSFERFKNRLSEFDKIRYSVADKWGWLTANDILRDLKNENIPSGFTRQQFKFYGGAVVIAAALTLFLANTTTLVSHQVKAATDLQNYANRESRQSSALDQLPDKQPVVVDYPEQPLPENGAVHSYSSKRAIAPLKITVPDAGEHYFAKVVDVATDKPVKVVFIWSGNSVEIKVPLGTYRVKYACGNTWYGRKYLFGPETSVSVADQDLHFRREGDHVTGYSIELIKRQNGNLRTQSISLDDF